MSGSTHKNGMTATSCESLFVVARSSTDAIAGSDTHSSLSTLLTSALSPIAAPSVPGAIKSGEGANSAGVEGTSTGAGVMDTATGREAFFQTRNAQYAQKTTNNTSPPDHIAACV